jgi:DNA-binding transcriptional ArsR family regulator
METTFAILAEPSRRAMLQLLAASERTVGEIERQLDLPQPSVSKHLRVLREAGFVESRVDAQRRVYRLRPEAFMEQEYWLAPLRPIWAAHADALERHLDRTDRMERTPAGRRGRKSTRPKGRTR